MKSIFLSLLAACVVLNAAEPESKPPSATLTNGAALDSDILGASQAYVIKVKFERDIPVAFFSPRIFKVQDADNNTIVPVKLVRILGIGKIVDGVTNISGVRLEGDFNPERSYLLWVSLPNETPFSIPVAVLLAGQKAAAKLEKPTFNLHYRFLTVELNPFSADVDNAFGLKYDVRYIINQGYVGKGLLNLELQTHGEFSITPKEDSVTSIQNSLNGGLTANYLYNVPVRLALPKGPHTYLYPMGFRISPAEFEANKGFSDVNYSFKALLGGAIPFADYPALLWNQIFNLEVPFFAPTLYTGFAALTEVKDDNTDTLAKLGHTRWDTEFLYYLPLHNRVDFKFTWNWYVGLEKSFNKDNYEVGVVVYMDDKRSHGFTLSRQKGALPPDFIETEAWRIGYTAKF